MTGEDQAANEAEEEAATVSRNERFGVKARVYLNPIELFVCATIYVHLFVLSVLIGEDEELTPLYQVFLISPSYYGTKLAQMTRPHLSSLSRSAPPFSKPLRRKHSTS